MKAQGVQNFIKIPEGNQGIIGDIFCKYFKRIFVHDVPQNI